MSHRKCGCPYPKMTRDYDPDYDARVVLIRFVHVLLHSHMSGKIFMEAARKVMATHYDLLKRLEDED